MTAFTHSANRTLRFAFHGNQARAIAIVSVSAWAGAGAFTAKRKMRIIVPASTLTVFHGFEESERQ
jgi:hypothetical protein